jgi:glutamate carboxypeptidase
MMTQPGIEWLEQQADSMASDLTTLCDMNSGSENVEGLERVAAWLQDYFDPIGTPCQRIALSNFQYLNDDGVSIEQATGPALRWDWASRTERISPSEKKPLLLTIHYDTVYGPLHPFQRCKREGDFRMVGPGVIDAKGGIVVLRYAAIAASRFLCDSSLRFSVVLTPDEEIGSPASTQLWTRICREFGFGLLFEPSMSDRSLVSTRKGTGNFVFKIEGQAAHAGRNFQAGRNAIAHAALLIRDLHELNGERENVTINVGRIQGGGAVNVVPDLVVLRVNVRVANGDDQAWVETQVRQIAERYDTHETGFRVHVEGGIHSPPKPLDPTAGPWMRWVEEEGTKMGTSIHWKPSGGASDGNKLQAFGLPNIDTLGPDGDGLHSDQEWVDLTSLPKKACMVFRLLARYANHSEAR